MRDTNGMANVARTAAPELDNAASAKLLLQRCKLRYDLGGIGRSAHAALAQWHVIVDWSLCRHGSSQGQ